MTLIKPTRRQDQTVVLQSNSTITVDDLQDNQIGINQENGSISFIKVVDNQKQLATVSSATPTIVHNNTTSRQGGNSTESYHLTETDYTDKIVNRRFGTVTASNYTEFESTGFQKNVGNAIYWRDIDFPIVVRTTGANIPSYQTIQGNLTTPRWAVNDFYQCDVQEMVHEWKEGSTCYWHLHMITNGTDTTNRFVKWEVEYTYVNVGGQLVTNTANTFEVTIPANTASKTMILVSISNFTPTTLLIGGHVYARLRRIASTGTAPTNDPFCGMLQLHVQCDTLGSRSMSAK